MPRLRRPAPQTCHNCQEKSCATEMLGSEELDLITGNRYMNEVRKRTTLMNAGAPGSFVIYLREGLVKEFLLNPDGREHILQIIQPNSFLGLNSLFGDRTNHYSYAALTDLKVCYIDSSVFTSLIRSNGNFAFEILKSMGEESISNYHRFIDRSNKKTFGRIADLLLYFSRVIFRSSRFEIPLSRKEVADMLGTSRESAGRVLSKFHSDGLVEIKGKKIFISDLKKLEKISRLG